MLVGGLIGASSLLAACGPGLLPPVLAPAARRSRLVRSSSFRLGVLDFGSGGEGTGAESSVHLTKAIPAMVATELKLGARFAVHEGGGIRAGGGAIHESAAHNFVDAYMSGTVTAESATQACFDLRITNAFTHEVIFAKSACVPLTRSPGITPDRAAIKRVAEEITRAIKEVGNAKVTAVDGQFIFVNKGAEADVLPGMVAIVIATGDASVVEDRHRQVQALTKVNPASFDSAKVQVIIGEIAIVSVEKTYSVGLLHQGDYALPGDTVFFK